MCLHAGPFAVISIMIGSVTGLLMPNSNFMDPVNGTNETVLNEARRDSARVELVATLTVLVGIFQVSRVLRGRQETGPGSRLGCFQRLVDGQSQCSRGGGGQYTLGH